MSSTFYNVSITALSLGGNGDGFIDNKRIEQYMAEGSSPATKAQSQTKERGNIRYDAMIGRLGLMGNLYISNIVATGANAISSATAFSFTLESEHGDDCLVVNDELNSGARLTGNAAIKRSIARALMQNRSDRTDYYDPTQANAIVNDGSVVSAVRFGNRIEDVVANAVANTLLDVEAAITVTKI